MQARPLIGIKLFGWEASLASNPFIVWLAEVAAEPVVIRPDNIGAEANSNLWSFTLSPEQAATVSTADIVRFAEQVTEARRGWLVSRETGPMVLYWWHDAQAGQLRFSMVSAVHGHLPFGCKVVAAPSIELVVEEWLRSADLHGIPWSKLQPATAGETEPSLSSLSVWSQTLP